MPFRFSRNADQPTAARAHVCTWCNEQIERNTDYYTWRNREGSRYHGDITGFTSKMHAGCYHAALNIMRHGEEYQPAIRLRGSAALQRPEAVEDGEDEEDSPIPAPQVATKRPLPEFTILIARKASLEPRPGTTNTPREWLLVRIEGRDYDNALAKAIRQCRDMDRDAHTNGRAMAFNRAPNSADYYPITWSRGFPAIRRIISETDLEN